MIIHSELFLRPDRLVAGPDDVTRSPRSRYWATSTPVHTRTGEADLADHGIEARKATIGPGDNRRPGRRRAASPGVRYRECPPGYCAPDGGPTSDTPPVLTNVTSAITAEICAVRNAICAGRFSVP